MAAMSGMATLLRQRIAQARHEAELPQATVESELNLPAGAFSKIENGSRAITSTELGEFARLSGRHIAWFFDSEPAPIAKLRGLANSPAGRADIAWLQEFAEAFCYLKNALGDEWPLQTRP